MNHVIAFISACSFNLCLAQFAFADESANQATPISRYVSVKPIIDESKLWPLNHVYSFNAGQHPTIGTAIGSLLSKIGYQLHSDASSFDHILGRPVPEIHGEFELLRVHQIIRTLMGVPYKIVVDPTTRQISFKLDPAYLEGSFNSETPK